MHLLVHADGPRDAAIVEPMIPAPWLLTSTLAHPRYCSGDAVRMVPFAPAPDPSHFLTSHYRGTVCISKNAQMGHIGFLPKPRKSLVILEDKFSPFDAALAAGTIVEFTLSGEFMQGVVMATYVRRSTVTFTKQALLRSAQEKLEQLAAAAPPTAAAAAAAAEQRTPAQEAEAACAGLPDACYTPYVAVWRLRKQVGDRDDAPWSIIAPKSDVDLDCFVPNVWVGSISKVLSPADGSPFFPAADLQQRAHSTKPGSEVRFPHQSRKTLFDRLRQAGAFHAVHEWFLNKCKELMHGDDPTNWRPFLQWAREQADAPFPIEACMRTRASMDCFHHVMPTLGRLTSSSSTRVRIPPKPAPSTPTTQPDSRPVTPPRTSKHGDSGAPHSSSVRSPSPTFMGDEEEEDEQRSADEDEEDEQRSADEEEEDEQHGDKEDGAAGPDIIVLDSDSEVTTRSCPQRKAAVEADKARRAAAAAASESLEATPATKPKRVASLKKAPKAPSSASSAAAAAAGPASRSKSKKGKTVMDDDGQVGAPIPNYAGGMQLSASRIAVANARFVDLVDHRVSEADALISGFLLLHTESHVGKSKFQKLNKNEVHAMMLKQRQPLFKRMLEFGSDIPQERLDPQLLAFLGWDDSPSTAAMVEKLRGKGWRTPYKEAGWPDRHRQVEVLWSSLHGTPPPQHCSTVFDAHFSGIWYGKQYDTASVYAEEPNPWDAAAPPSAAAPKPKKSTGAKGATAASATKAAASSKKKAPAARKRAGRSAAPSGDEADDEAAALPAPKRLRSKATAASGITAQLQQGVGAGGRQPRMILSVQSGTESDDDAERGLGEGYDGDEMEGDYEAAAAAAPTSPRQANSRQASRASAPVAAPSQVRRESAALRTPAASRNLSRFILDLSNLCVCACVPV